MQPQLVGGAGLFCVKNIKATRPTAARIVLQPSAGLANFHTFGHVNCEHVNFQQGHCCFRADQLENQHRVLDCSKDLMRDHCYWPVVSDLINVLSHRSVAHSFMRDERLLQFWLEIMSGLQGERSETRIVGVCQVFAAIPTEWSVMMWCHLLCQNLCIFIDFRVVLEKACRTKKARTR